MTGQQLKNSILQMAVQGKLVPQDPNDEPASVLLERIRKEKERLVREKKIKPEKNPSFIFRGADNLPYEKIGKEVRCIADEVPFEIPASWEWARLGSVIELQSGQDLTPDKYNAECRGIPYITGASNIDSGEVKINRWTEYPRAMAYKGELLLTCKGTVGTMAILQTEKVHIARQIMAIHSTDEVEMDFLKIVIESLVGDLQSVAKSMIPGISREDILSALMPIPPYEEQRRIVKQFKNITPLIVEYGTKEDALSRLNASLPSLLKKTILQEAIQGKLVPQNPNDEPASVLLERIRKEKARLVKEGKLKPDKHESVIFRRDNSHYEKRDGKETCIDAEIPFEIPENWAWTRASSLGMMIRGRGIMRNETTSEGKPCIRYGEIYTSYNVAFKITKSFISLDLDKRCLHLSNGDIVFTLTGENKVDIAKSVAFVGDGKVAAGGDLAYWTEHGMNPLYIVFYMASPFCIEQKRNTATGDIIVHISTTKVGEFLIPVPPLREQSRIVEVIQTIFSQFATL